MIKYKFFWLSLFILFFALFFPFNGNKSGPSYDKVAHIILFAFVSVNTFFYFPKDRKQLLIILGIIATLPVLTEVIQHFIPRRNFDWKDIVADYVGLLAGWVIFIVLKKPLIVIYEFFGDDYASHS